MHNMVELIDRQEHKYTLKRLWSLVDSLFLNEGVFIIEFITFV